MNFTKIWDIILILYPKYKSLYQDNINLYQYFINKSKGELKIFRYDTTNLLEKMNYLNKKYERICFKFSQMIIKYLYELKDIKKLINVLIIYLVISIYKKFYVRLFN